MSNNFNLVAPLYDRLADLVYGGDIQAAQDRFIEYLPEEGKVLFIGGGSGQTLLKILKQKPQLSIHYLEASSRMMEISKKLISKKDAERVEFMVGTEESLMPQQQFDGIITFFFLDLFGEEKKSKIFKKLDKHLKKKVIWLHADFLPAKDFLSRSREKIMMLFFKIFSSIEANNINNDMRLFRRNGYQIAQHQFFHKKQIYSAVYRRMDLGA